MGDKFDDLGLPEKVPCLSFWQPYAQLVIAGVKTLETRNWPWPYPSGWLVIHEAKHLDRKAALRPREVLSASRDDRAARSDSHGGKAIGIVWVAAPSRQLLPEDEPAACFYEKGRLAWPLERSLSFAEPIVMRGPQKFVFLECRTVLRALRGSDA